MSHIDVPERLERLTSHEISRLLAVVSTGLRGPAKRHVACGGAARTLRRTSSTSNDTPAPAGGDGAPVPPPSPPPAAEPLRNLSSRYGAALDALRAFREVTTAELSTHEPDYKSYVLSGRKARPQTARPQLSTQYYKAPAMESPPTSPARSPPQIRPFSASNTAGSSVGTVGSIVGHRIDGANSGGAPRSSSPSNGDANPPQPSSAQTATAGSTKKAPAVRPNSAPAKVKVVPAESTNASATTVNVVQQGGPSGRRPLSAKKQPSMLTDRDRAVVGRVLEQEAKMWGGVDDDAFDEGITRGSGGADAKGKRDEVVDDDAAMGIVGDDGELEDAALENLQFVFRPRQGQGQQAQRGTSARHRPVSAKQQQPSTFAADDEKWHVLGTADGAKVRADQAPPMYFNAFEYSGISDFLRTQKTETFGTYRERLSAYMAKKGIPNTRHNGGQNTPMGSERAFLAFVEKEAQRREKERRVELNSARLVAGARRHLPTHQEAALRSPHHPPSETNETTTGARRPVSARLAEDQVRDAYRRLPLKGAAKPAATQRW